MDNRDAQLRQALAAFMRDMAVAGDLPVLAPQSVQSGSPTPQDVGQTLGPQPGERRNVSRQQWMQDFGQAAGSFGASAADPFGIPSAITGMVSPQMRDSWRQYQGAAGPVVQMAGGMASGFPAANAMIRGGSLIAGVPGMIAGGAATGAGPAIDYAAGAPGATGTNAMIAPAMGAVFPAGMAAGQFARNNPGATAGLAGLGALAVGTSGDASAEPKGATKRVTPPQPLQDNQYTQTLLANNPVLASRQRTLREAEAALAVAEQNYANEQTGANRRILTQRREAVGPLREAFDQELSRVTDLSRGQSPTFREQFGPILANNMVRQIGIPFAFGMLGGAGSAARQRYLTGQVNRMVDEGNAALTAGNNALARQFATDAQNTLTPGGNGIIGRALNAMANIGSYAFPAMIGAEAAVAPAQWNQGLPQGHPEQQAAENYMRSPEAWRDAGIGALFGITGYKGGRFAATNLAALAPGGISPQGRVTSLTTRANEPAPAPPQQPPPPPVSPPPVAPPVQPPTNNLPTDFESILRGIGEQIPRRNVRGPIGSNPAAPGLSYDATTNSADMFRQAVANHLRSGNLLTGFNAADFRRRVVEAAQAAGATEAQVPSVRVFRDALDRLQQLIASEGLSPAQAARRITAPNRRGGFENFAIPVMAGGGAAASAHHSLSQPRGDDGRFTTP
jgi:hypothetical protein